MAMVLRDVSLAGKVLVVVPQRPAQDVRYSQAFQLADLVKLARVVFVEVGADVPGFVLFGHTEVVHQEKHRRKKKFDR
jgi:hypothetical protein